MKNFFFPVAVALLMLASCDKSTTIVAEPEHEIAFKALPVAPTRAGELNGSSFDADAKYAMYVSASQYTSSGLSENPLFFTNQVFRNSGSSSEWHHYDSETAAAASPIYWPVGGARVDFLAFALPKGDRALIEGTGASVSWNADVSAKDFTISGWDTYAAQSDLLFSSANARTSESTGTAPFVKMTFDHAQALLIFNIKVNDADAALKVDDISFVTPDYNLARNAEMQLGGGGKEPSATTAPTAAQVTLKTKGTLLVDNSRNDLLCSWSFPDADGIVAANWRMPVTAASLSPCNGGVSAISQYGAALSNTTAYNQLGDTLLIPQQDKQNFTVTYTIGGNHMQYTYNELRGVWQAGKKYIYNLDVSVNEIIITETVNDFVAETSTPVIN